MTAIITVPRPSFFPPLSFLLSSLPFNISLRQAQTLVMGVVEKDGFAFIDYITKGDKKHNTSELELLCSTHCVASKDP